MIVSRHRNFLKHYKSRIAPDEGLKRKCKERLLLFLGNPTHLLIRDHALIGTLRGFRAFCVTGDIRVVYRVLGDEIELYDIGTHNQVY